MSPRFPRDDPERLLSGLDLERHLDDPTIKQRFVTAMFGTIAERYDRFTRVFSFGMDAGWKQRLLQRVPRDGPALIADLACGTGDLTRGAARVAPAARIVGFDVVPRMVRLAANRGTGDNEMRLHFALGDMTRIPLADRSVDVVTVGYGVRNAPRPSCALVEIARVLRPGGLLLTLDFYRPARPLWRRLFLGYLQAAGNLVGWLWHREPVAYGYIAPSIARHLTSGEFCDALRAHGFEVVWEDRRLWGGVALHGARRRVTAESG